jgi:hypothetical protein
VCVRVCIFNLLALDILRLSSTFNLVHVCASRPEGFHNNIQKIEKAGVPANWVGALSYQKYGRLPIPVGRALWRIHNRTFVLETQDSAT